MCHDTITMTSTVRPCVRGCAANYREHRIVLDTCLLFQYVRRDCAIYLIYELVATSMLLLLLQPPGSRPG
jgi:hypothetical protein